jgi:hypothetical protein
MVVDRLLATLGEGEPPLRKLEVYTFGSAANHMHGNNILGCIEHFANNYDFVARTGVMAYHRLEVPGNRYDGERYIVKVATGHLLNMHYLRTMFRVGRPLADFSPGKPPLESRMARYLGGRDGTPVSG